MSCSCIYEDTKPCFWRGRRGVSQVVTYMHIHKHPPHSSNTQQAPCQINHEVHKEFYKEDNYKRI